MGPSATRARFWPAAVRPAERGRFGFLIALAAALHLAQTIGFVGTEALFLTRLGPERLPLTFVLASLVTVAASLLYAGRVGRARNDRVFVELLLLAAAAVGLGAAATARWDGALPVLFCLFFATQAVLISHYWSFVGDLFEPLAAKRVVPLFTVGMSLGGALGGAIALLAVGTLPTSSLVAGWSIALAATALGVRAARARLRRWGALEAVEEDETSFAGLRAALQHLRTNRLARGLVAACLAMVLALFVAQYLYSAVFAASFPDEARLAAFFGLFLAATNLGEVAVELWVTPWLIRRVGVGGANVAHPLLSLFAFVGLAVQFRLPAAVALRVTREPLENALAAPVRQLVYNAIPRRLRARVRAFLEGIVVYSGMSLAGGVLLWIGGTPGLVLCGVGAGLAASYLLATLYVRRAYLEALVAQLRTGALELTEVGPEVGRRELSALSQLWDALLAEASERAGTLVSDLAILLARRGVEAPLERGLQHREPSVRSASLRAWGEAGRALPVARWLDVLADPAATVRATALRVVPEPLLERDEVRARVRDSLSDPDVAVRAEAAARLGKEGEGVFAALAEAPDPGSRAAALGALARAPRTVRVEAEGLARHLADPDARVRRAAGPLLARLGPAALSVARRLLEEGAESVARDLLHAVGALGSAESRDLLRNEFERHVRDAWSARLGLEPLRSDGPSSERFLRLAFADAAARALRLAFAALAQLEDPRVVRRVARTLRLPSRRARADALEVLSNLGPGDVAARLVLLIEPIPLADKLDALDEPSERPRAAKEILPLAARSASPTLRRAAAWVARGDTLSREEKKRMERLLFLRRVSLFSQLSLEQLEAIERITHPADYVRNEVIVREGAPGEELYLIEEGSVDVFRNHRTEREVRLNQLGPGGYFGEMAILDGAPRSATVVAATEVRLRVLDGERFRELLQERPEMGFDMMRVLTGRLRAAEGRLIARLDADRGLQNS